jgi:glutamine synthetase
MAIEDQGSGKISPDEVLKSARDKGIEMVDLRFVDLPGRWQHFSVPLSTMSEEVFSEGIGFDGSSVHGFQKIYESDMLLIPDPATATVDPMLRVPTLYMVCNVVDPSNRARYTRDPRYIAEKAEAYLAASGIADMSYWGPEPEFYIFNNIRFGQNAHSSYHSIDSDEGQWNTSQSAPNLGSRVRSSEAYAMLPPADNLQDLRSEIALKLMKAGIEVEVHHHEVGTGGQAEIDLRYMRLTRMADALMMCKYVIKNVCKQHGYVATFMPKPLYEENGSGMHTHQSLWKDGRNIFFDENSDYARLSQVARWYIGGLLDHAPALLALCAPTTNSYRRLVPGYEAPINMVYSVRNRSAMVRIPVYSADPKFHRIELRSPDATCNPYLAFAAMLMAGIDGIKNRTEPPPPLDKDVSELTAEEKEEVDSVPRSLDRVLHALEQDMQFLREGDVFTEDVLNTWIDYKETHDVDPVGNRPHPWEFQLYHDF